MKIKVCWVMGNRSTRDEHVSAPTLQIRMKIKITHFFEETRIFDDFRYLLLRVGKAFQQQQPHTYNINTIFNLMLLISLIMIMIACYLSSPASSVEVVLPTQISIFSPEIFIRVG